MGTERTGPLFDKDFCKIVIPIDDIPEKTGGLTQEDISGLIPPADDNAETLDGHHASEFSFISHEHPYPRTVSFTEDVDEKESAIFQFRTEGTGPLVYICIQGLRYPRRHYLDLPYHDHGTKEFASDDHKHGTTATAGAQSLSIVSGGKSADHQHDYGVAGPAGNYTGSDNADHTHTVAGATAGGAVTVTEGNPTASSDVDPAGVNISESLTSTSKTYLKTARVYIDGTEVTASILTAKGWSVIGDGSASHAFITTGTGLLEASSWVSFTEGMHTIEVRELTAGYGGRVMVYVETMKRILPSGE